MTFQLNGQEYIELMKLLKFMGLTDTGGDTKQAIDEGLVQVNGQQELRRRCKLRAGDEVLFDGTTIIIAK
ncbi:MAG: RNA-binding S4 domain-containing protein [Clostridia bacterium]|nr:RNA-binding S4 domain-containing protein [Clostridia bacterium]